MKKRVRKILRWVRWTLLTLILLPVVSLFFMKTTGAAKFRKSDDQILGKLYAYPITKKIDTAIINDRRITYLITSKGEKKKKNAILFVHGSPGSMDAFLKYMHDDSLLSEADLISYDRPGFGHSDFGKSLPSLRGQAKVLTSLMQVLDYDHYWLIGHSYGASVVIQATIDRPRKIAGIGIIAGSVIYEMEPVAAWRKWFDLPFIRPIMPTALRVSNDELMALRSDLRMIDDDWNEIRVPAALIHGEEDILVPCKNLELAKEKLVNSDTVRTLIFENDNHFILWTKPDMIVNEILALMKVSSSE